MTNKPAKKGTLNDLSYVGKKIAHMKRHGLIASNKSGFGPLGGACPDHMLNRRAEQNTRRPTS